MFTFMSINDMVCIIARHHLNNGKCGLASACGRLLITAPLVMMVLSLFDVPIYFNTSHIKLFGHECVVALMPLPAWLETKVLTAIV